MSELKFGSRVQYPNGFLIRYDCDAYTRELNIEINSISESAECFKSTCPKMINYLSRRHNRPFSRIAIETAKQIVRLIGNVSRPKILEINMSRIDESSISGINYVMTVKNGKWSDTLILKVSRQGSAEIFTKAFSKYYNKIKQEKI